MSLKNTRRTYNSKVFFYISENILSYFILTFFGFISLIILLQFIRISDLILVYSGNFNKIYLIIKYLVVLTLPIALPTSLLISIFFSYKNLKEENELIAFSALGIDEKTLLLPSLILTLLITILSGYCNSKLCPEAHLRSSILENQIKSNFLKTGLKSKTYYDQANFVIYYEDKINDKFINIFLKDKKRDAITFAKEGQFKSINGNDWYLILELNQGSTLTNRQKNLGNTFQFNSYSVPIPLNTKHSVVKLSHLNQTNSQIFGFLDSKKSIDKNKINNFYIELLKRLNLSITPFVFWITFLTFGFELHSRTSRTSTFSLGLLLGISYWLVFFTFEAIAFSSRIKFLVLIPPSLYLLFCFSILFLKTKKNNFNSRIKYVFS